MIIEKGIPDFLTVSVGSCQGDRTYQQDRLAYFARGNTFLGIVCDGMGGMEGGEEASTCAVETLRECFRKEIWTQLHPAEFLYRSACQMDMEVFELADEAGRPLKCGTTAAAVYIEGDRLFWMSVGDSKIYLYRNGIIQPLTREHNYLMLLNQYLTEGRIKEEEYEKELSRRDVLVSYIGMGQLPFIDLSRESIQLEEGDQLLICSDGLYRAIPEDQIAVLMTREKDAVYGMADAALLIQAAEQAGQRPLDNITAMTVLFNGITM